MSLVNDIRDQFPTLNQKVNSHPLTYLDSAATMQKPISVISAVHDYYLNDNANVHRGVHTLSQRATDQYEQTRDTIKTFINAEHQHEIIFTKGTTESINLVAQAFLRPQLHTGDEILISEMEHHSNIVPWQILCEQTGAILKIIPMLESGDLDLSSLPTLLNSKTKLLALTHISNALGTVNDIKAIIQQAHKNNTPVLIDGAQGIHHKHVDVQSLDCDFYVFSGHKTYGPTGVGILYGKSQWLNQMDPYQGGGDMIKVVNFNKSTYQDLPYKFEAGTPNIAGVIGFGKAIEFIKLVGLNHIETHEKTLMDYAKENLKSVNGLNLIANPNEQVGAISFTMDSAHPHDIGTILDQYGVAIRTGHHCAMPVMEFFKVPATARVSFGVYNTFEDIDHAVSALHEVNKVFDS